MYTIRRVNSRIYRMKSFNSKWCKRQGGSLKSAREGRSALFIMIKLKRGILISVRRSDLQLLLKLSWAPRITKAQTMEDLWCIKVIKTPILVFLRVLWIIFRSTSYLLVSLQHQVKMEVVGVGTLLSTKWWCKETFRCCNNNSKSCFPRSFRFNCRISHFKITLSIHCHLLTNLVSSLLWFSLAALSLGMVAWINKSSSISSTPLPIETAGAQPPPILLSIISSINLSKLLHLSPTKSRRENHQDP
jgi:hypothetical protein